MRLIPTFFAAAMALSLVACGSGDDKAPIKGDQVAAVTPPAGKQWVDVAKKTEEGGYLIGNPDAKIKLVEYLSVTCPHCREFEEEAFEPLLRDYVGTGKVSLEIRNFLLNPYDLPISILTRCSADEAYLPLTQQFYENQVSFMEGLQKVPQPTLEAAMKQPENSRWLALGQAMGVVDFFKARGVSEEQAKICLTDPAQPKKLIAMTEKATNELKVTGTPSFFINDVQIELTNQTPVWQQVKAKLAEAGAR